MAHGLLKELGGVCLVMENESRDSRTAGMSRGDDRPREPEPDRQRGGQERVMWSVNTS